MGTRAAIGLAASLLLTASAGHRAVAQQQSRPTATQCTREAAQVEGITLTTVRGVPPVAGSRLPAHCQIDGEFERRSGAAGKSYAIAFELRVPEQWNGRLLFQGGGGLDGSVNPALGEVIGSAPDTGLVRGFAVISTDSGHHGTDASFAADQLAKLNFAYASIGKVAIVAKHVLERVTGQAPRRTYFAGCSNGGREAMIAAQRFPEEFDGVVAGSPAFDLDKAVVVAHFSTAVYRAGAPRSADGAARLPLALLPSDTRMISAAILNQCDALDGIRDGFVFNQSACRFDPKVLQCRPGEKTGCLSADKVRMIRAAFAGPRLRGGKALASWTYDTGIDSDQWRIWQMGLMMNDKPVVILPRLVDETIARYFNYPMLDPSRLDPLDAATMMRRMAPTAALTDASSTNMSSFSAAGGKMLIVSGWSEPVFPPSDLLAWYRRLDSDMSAGARTPAPTFARLFMVPGMTHCGGGPSLDQFDALTALVDWVERGRAPDRLIATGKAYPGVSRPLCPYPEIATYRGGPPSDQSSFSCEVPGPPVKRGDMG